MDRRKIKVFVTVNYVDKFVFNDVYEASTFMTMYARGSNNECKFELIIKFEEVEEVEDPVYSEPVPTRGVDFDYS